MRLRPVVAPWILPVTWLISPLAKNTKIAHFGRQGGTLKKWCATRIFSRFLPRHGRRNHLHDF
jgi:hypothetical protein